MKKLAEIKGAKVLDGKAQQSIVAGRAPVCDPPLIAVFNPHNCSWSCCEGFN